MAANMWGMDQEECFLDHDEVVKMLENAGTRCAWDFNTALGDTIREKYESLYIKVVEVTNVLIRKGASGLFWICASPEVASIFEVATMGFFPTSQEQFELGTKKVYKLGVMQRRWSVYVDPSLETNQVLIGCGEHKMHENDEKSYAAMSVANFVI
jgi:hypothetical protein